MLHKWLAPAQPGGQPVHHYFPQWMVVVSTAKAEQIKQGFGQRWNIPEYMAYASELSGRNGRVSGHFHNNACHYMPSKRDLYTDTYILFRYADILLARIPVRVGLVSVRLADIRFKIIEQGV
jgi:hypothetical protein